jgi:hypothetical protein
MELDSIVNSDEIEMDDLLELGFSQKELNFSINDFADLNTDQTIADIEEATESQISKTEELVRALGARAINIHQVFGFKHVPGEYAKAVSDFMTMIQANSGDEDASVALGKFCEHYVRMNDR